MSHRRSHRRSAHTLAAVVALGAAGGWSLVLAPLGPAPASAGAATPAATPPPFAQFKWSSGALADAGNPIAESSPNVATLNGQGPAVVVGDRDGRVYAFPLTGPATGVAHNEIPGWPAETGVPITSTPSVSEAGSSGLDDVYVGSGNAEDPDQGGYQGFGPDGQLLWFNQVVDPPSDTNPAQGVQASLTVGTLQPGGPDVVAGSLDQEEYALNAGSGGVLAGWPFFTSDSVFSTPALADLYGTGNTEIVEGGDQTHGYGIGQSYSNGGHLRILNASGGLVCHYDTTQTVESSPAIGGILSGSTGIVMGTGQYFAGAADTDTVMAFNTSCGLAWQTRLDGYTNSSPAIADMTGNGILDVVEGTQKPTGGGTVWVLGGTGAPLWDSTTTGAVLGSVVTADLTGAGYQDLLVPTTQGVDLFDGRSHVLVQVLNGVGTTAHGVLGFQNAPLVTDDPNGDAGITVAGYGCSGKSGCFGQIEHYEIPGSTGAKAVGAGAWPQFHHDPQLTGNVDPQSEPGDPRCTVPAGALAGYNLVASDGGIFSFGQTPFCGSTGGISLNAPIVGMAMAPNTGGYWLAASDGGIFAYGGARFYGSMGGRPLNKPIVAIASTPDGKGYWLVASDGGVFAFGDARFDGSTGSLTLQAPIVGMTTTPDGLGYRLVASDGGVFAFGDNQFFGSMGGRPLNSPIVAMANDDATAGYWEVAADGGVFAFNAPFFGSMGGQFLAAPIVGVTASQNGTGYRFVAADGGIFAYGIAPFFGSMGGRPLNEPIVGMAGF